MGCCIMEGVSEQSMARLHLTVRVVGLENKPKSETIHREFTVPHYLPLRSSFFNEVVLELTDGMGDSMKFNQGNSVTVFHFKKKR